MSIGDSVVLFVTVFVVILLVVLTFVGWQMRTQQQEEIALELKRVIARQYDLEDDHRQKLMQMTAQLGAITTAVQAMQDRLAALRAEALGVPTRRIRLEE